MKLLDAVNLIMPKLGERAVTSLEVKHPTLSILLPIVDIKLRMLLQRGWWFNKYPTTLYPDVDGKITVGTDVLAFVPDTNNTAVVRGQNMFNPVTLSYTFTEPVSGILTQYVAFDDLPESAATHVFYAACVEAYTTDLGVTQDLSVWQTMSGQSFSDLMMEHLRQVKHSTKNTKAWSKYQRALRGS